MFVFGEIQDPQTDTVNLVEDIIRSQLVELVRILYCFRLYSCPLTLSRRLFKHERRRTAVEYAISPLKILYFSFATTAPKSIDYAHICLGKTSESMPRTRTRTEVVAWRWRTWKTVLMVSPPFFMFSQPHAQRLQINLPQKLRRSPSSFLGRSRLYIRKF